MDQLADDLDAFFTEHRCCGELEGGIDDLLGVDEMLVRSGDSTAHPGACLSWP